MSHFLGHLSEPDGVYNYRHERACLHKENTLGCLLYNGEYSIDQYCYYREEYSVCVMVCLTLHNHIRQTKTSLYFLHGFVDIGTIWG